MGERCLFCKRKGGSPAFAISERLFYETHEAAALGECIDCGQKYLRYFVECRDNSLDYYCQVTGEQWRSLKALTTQSELRAGIVALVRGQEVFFCAPWVKEWAQGARVLLAPQPW